MGIKDPRLILEDVRAYKKQAEKRARDLGYGKEVIEQIKKAGSIIEIDRIMKSARKRYWSKMEDVWD